MSSFIDQAREVLNIEIDALKHVSQNLSEDQLNTAISLIQKSSGRVIVMGMGKSGIIGQKISASLSSTGTKSYFIHPAEAYHGDLGTVSSSDIILLISNSGETEEVLKLLSFFKESGNQIIALTGNEKSTLAKYSDAFLNVHVEKEACPLELAPTSSTTATLAMGDVLTVCLMKAKNFQKENFALYHPGGSLGRKLLLRASDVMKKENLPIINETAGFDEIVSSIGEGRLGVSVVVNSNKEVLGVISDGDVRRAFSAYKEKVISVKASDIMTKKPLTIKPDTKIIEAEKIFLDKKISVLVITNKENALVGLINIYDL